MSKQTEMYLELLKRMVLNTIYKDDNMGPFAALKYSEEQRHQGHSWPSKAHTMIGRLRLDNIHDALDYARTHNIPGDFIETGVWRGGASIFVRGYYKVHNEARTAWLADSFEGLPPPSAQYPVDNNSAFHAFEELKVSLEEVQDNFKAYGLLDDGVQFLKGWFKDTLHKAPIEKLSVLRLDGDMYESTIQTLDALYDKVSPGGWVIVDDYWIHNCKAAVDDFRAAHGIDCGIASIDWTGIYWIK